MTTTTIKATLLLVQVLFSCAILSSSSWEDRSCCLAFSSYKNFGGAATFYQKSSLTPSSSQSSADNVIVLKQSSSATSFSSSSSSPSPRWPEHRTTTAATRISSFNQNDIVRLNAFTSSSSSSADNNNNNDNATPQQQQRGLEALKQIEAELKKQLDDIQYEKRLVLKSRPLNIGVVGFGRFGRFISATLTKYGRVVATSRSDYSDIATGMGVKYIRLTNPQEFLSFHGGLDVIIFATSILSFESTIQSFIPHLEKDLAARRQRQKQRSLNGDDEQQKVTGPLIVDVLSVKEHPRQIMLQYLPKECDILCTHPMFGPDSGKNGWANLNFVYEKTRINGELLDQDNASIGNTQVKSTDHVEGIDRMERFLSIWEEEGCYMIEMSCRVHDEYASNSQFITHLMGRILGSQGLSPTPIDTSGFKSVLRLIDSTTADSFDLFYGLYKFNTNSRDTITQLKSALDEVVNDLSFKEKQEQKYLEQRKQQPATKTHSLTAAVNNTLAASSSAAPAGEEFTQTTNNNK